MDILMAEETVMSGVAVTTAAIIAPVVMGMARIVSIRPREVCLMKNMTIKLPQEKTGEALSYIGFRGKL
jgi:hypothetical protein